MCAAASLDEAAASIDSFDARADHAPAMPLQRVLEPEVMDSEEEAIEYDSMDHAAVNKRFCDDLIALSPDLSRVLDLGTGTALIPIEICRRSTSSKIVAIDLATSMIALAKANIERAGLVDIISIEYVDAKSLPYDDSSFSCAISNSIAHHIPDPIPMLREARRTLAPGGLLFIRDLIRPDNDDNVRALVDAYAAGATDRQRALFDASLRAAFTIGEVRDLATNAGIPASAVRQTSDRHWTLSWMRPRE